MLKSLTSGLAAAITVNLPLASEILDVLSDNMELEPKDLLEKLEFDKVLELL